MATPRPSRPYHVVLLLPAALLVLSVFAATSLLSGCSSASSSRTRSDSEPLIPMDTDPMFEEISVPDPGLEGTAPAAEELLVDVWPASARRDQVGRADGPRKPVVEVTHSGGTQPSTPAVAGPLPDPRSARDPLKDRVVELLLELTRFRDRNEARLADGERLAKHKLVSQLINLHFLLPGRETGHLPVLLEALQEPHGPGTSYTLLRAAFYHDVGLEELRDRALSSLPSEDPARDRRLVVENLTLCQRVGGYRNYTPYPGAAFKMDQQVWIYAELLNLRSEPSGGMWRQGARVKAELFDERGDSVDVRSLTQPSAEWRETYTRLPQNYICCDYRFPIRREPGKYRLVVTVTDLGTDTSARQELSLEIVR